MSKSFRERLENPKVTIVPEDSIIPDNLAISRLTFVKKFQSEGHTFIDKITHYDRIISKDKAQLAKNHIDASVRMILGHDHTLNLRKGISDKDQMRIISLLKELIIGNKSTLVFQLNGAADGLIEVVSGREFKFVDEKEKSTTRK